MSIGTAALTTNQKKDPQSAPAPPFDPSSADNGLSVDSVSGRIVLGNDLGAATQSAQLLNDREILMEDSGGNPFRLYLTSVFAAVQSALSGYSLEIAGGNNTSPSIQIGTGDGSNAQIAIATGLASSSDINIQAQSGRAAMSLFCGNDLAEWLSDGSSMVTFSVSDFGIPIAVMTFYTSTQKMQFGGIQVAANGADVQISGTSTRRYLVDSKGAVTYNVDRDLDSDKLFINSGAATFNLPNMAAANNRAGFVFRVAVKNAGGVTVVAFAGQIIRFDGITTSAGGTVSNTSIGSVVTLMWDSTDWVAESFTGAWIFT